MWNRIRARPLATVNGGQNSIQCCRRKLIRYDPVNNISMKNNVAHCYFIITLTMLCINDKSNKKGNENERIYLHRGSFWWPWRCNGAMQTSSPDVACPGLHHKPLDATIGRILTLYCPGGCQRDSKQNNDEKCTNFAGRFDMAVAVRRYNTTCVLPDGGGPGLH